MDIAILHDLLVKDLFGSISMKDGRRFARLKESGVDAKLKQVDIYDLPEGSLLINLDAYEQPKSLFKGKKGERQRCDYVLATHMGGQPFLVFIEMKSKVLKEVEIERQFKGAECVLDYCDAALDRFHGANGFLRKFKKRFVVFYRPRMAKKRTRPIFLPGNNDAPKRALRYPSPRTPSLKSLVGI